MVISFPSSASIAAASSTLSLNWSEVILRTSVRLMESSTLHDFSCLVAASANLSRFFLAFSTRSARPRVNRSLSFSFSSFNVLMPHLIISVSLSSGHAKSPSAPSASKLTTGNRPAYVIPSGFFPPEYTHLCTLLAFIHQFPASAGHDQVVNDCSLSGSKK